MLYSGLSDTGRKRASNQDCFRIKIAGNLLVALVCDGMGGTVGGNIASTLAADVYMKILCGYINSALSFIYGGDIPEFNKPCDNFPDIPLDDFINKSIDLANSEVYKLSVNDKSLEGMGTTLTSCIVKPGGIVTANIGDSSIFHINNGKITKLTRDHSLVQNLIDSGEITNEEAYFHPNKNIILRALGVDEQVKADISYFDITEGYILLCSDGLSNYMNESIFTEIIESRKSCSTKAKILIDYANECGGSDNITAVVIKL